MTAKQSRRRPIRLCDFNDIQLWQLDRCVKNAEAEREQLRREGICIWAKISVNFYEALARPSGMLGMASDAQLKRLVKALKKRQETENFLWLLEWVGSGYQGRLFYVGTENQVERIRADKCKWEHCIGQKYKLRKAYGNEKEGEQT
jgi:hypothetical protein